MNDLFKKFLFTKHVLVSEGSRLTLEQPNNLESKRIIFVKHAPPDEEEFQTRRVDVNRNGASDEELREEERAERCFNALFAFANLLNIKITAGRNLASIELLQFAQDEMGRDVPEPFYRGFPNSVRELTPNQLLFDQLVHYALTYGLNDFDGPAGHSIFEGDFERIAFEEDAPPCKEFRILTEETAVAELRQYVANALASSRPLSETLFNVVVEYIRTYGLDVETCASKDTAAKLWIWTEDANLLKFLTLADVIRIVEIINHHGYYRNSIKRLTLGNATRRRISGLIDAFFERGDVNIRDCFEKKKSWQGLLHHIHYRAKTKEAKRFLKLMRGRGNKSAYAEFEKLMKAGKLHDAIAALVKSKGVGALVRRMDYIVSRSGGDESIILDIASRLRSTNLILLLQLAVHNLSKRTAPQQDRRVFTFSKFNLLRVHEETKKEIQRRKTSLSDDERRTISALLVDALNSALEKKLGTVYIDPNAGRVALPLQEATASGGFGVLPQGTRIPIMPGKKIRAFTYWEKVNDIDLSFFGLDDQGRKLEEFSWRTMWQRQSDVAVFSGDETRGYYGGSEYFDVDLDVLRDKRPKFRYLLFCNSVFTNGAGFKSCFCKAGFMYRDALDSGEVYEPKTVQTSFLIDANTSFAYLFAIDLKTNEFIWLNASQDGSVRVAGATPMRLFNNFIRSSQVLTMNDLLRMAATQVVSEPGHADLVFTDKSVELLDGIHQGLHRLTDEAESAVRVKPDAVVLRPYDTERFIAFINGRFDALETAPRAETLVEPQDVVAAEAPLRYGTRKILIAERMRLGY